jgi:hypothetical protein
MVLARHHFFQKFAKSLRPGGERQHHSSIFSKIELRKHLAAVHLRTDPENELVAPIAWSRFQSRRHGVG